MTKDARATAPSFSRLLVDITCAWAQHLNAGWMAAAVATSALTREKQAVLDRVTAAATSLGVKRHAPGSVMVHNDLEPGALMSVTFNLTRSESGFSATSAMCDCTYLAVVGLPCAHVIAAANAISGPRVAHVRATSIADKAHTQRALYEVYGVLGHRGPPNPTRLKPDSLQPPVWLEESRRAIEVQCDAERATSRGMPNVPRCACAFRQTHILVALQTLGQWQRRAWAGCAAIPSRGGEGRSGNGTRVHPTRTWMTHTWSARLVASQRDATAVVGARRTVTLWHIAHAAPILRRMCAPDARTRGTMRGRVQRQPLPDPMVARPRSHFRATKPQQLYGRTSRGHKPSSKTCSRAQRTATTKHRLRRRRSNRR